jgi:hypothetical protein
MAITTKKASYGLILVGVSAPLIILACSKKEEKKSPASIKVEIKADAAQTYDFGTVASGQKKDVTIDLTNTGEEDATSLGESGLEAPFSIKGGEFPGVGGTCTETLAAGASCQIVIEYAPSVTVYTKVSHEDDLAITYSGKTAPEFRVSGAGDYCSQQSAIAALTNSAGSSHLAYESANLVMAQSFTPASNLDLTNVNLNLYKGASANIDSVVLRVRSTSSVGSSPDVTDLGTATLLGSTIPTSSGLVTFTFAQPLTLTAGTKYWFLIDPGTSNITNGTLATYLYVKGAFTDTFSGGDVKFGVDDSPSWNSWTYDLNFEMKSCTAI